jgi:hypothetical protein
MNGIMSIVIRTDLSASIRQPDEPVRSYRPGTPLS